MSEFRIHRAAVLGAGTMGSRIAAHLANAGIPCYLLDMVPTALTPDEQRAGLSPDSPAVHNRIVTAGWRSALNAKPAALYSPELGSMVTVGNFADNLQWVEKADWIIEAVTEDLQIKRSLIGQVLCHRRPETIFTSNTSGIPLHRIAEGYPDEFQAHFLGTHFFNPPRYLKLLEIIPTPSTAPELVRFMARFGEQMLGKGVVICKDTPGFIANRIGICGLSLSLRSMAEEGLTVEQVDALTGPLLGRPKSATFRTVDVVGLDTFAHVARNLHDSVMDNAERPAFVLPPYYAAMLQKGWLGEKTGQGFYRRTKGGIEYLDCQSLQYKPLQKPTFAGLEKVAKASLPDRLRALVQAEGPAGSFVWKALSSTLTYAAAKVPEISDDIASIDSAMRWGFGHELGPFEIWDALGVKKTAERLSREGRPVPPLVEQLLESGNVSFYKKRADKTYSFAPQEKSYAKQALPVPLLRCVKDRNKPVLENAGASLWDLGDGVACLEFHSKMNSVDADVLAMMNHAIDKVVEEFEGMVLGNSGENFCAGANLMMILGAARQSNWSAVEQAIRGFQGVTMRMRYCEKPVVVAPHNMTLGGGCEIAIHGDLIHASPELYMGFAEAGVGLIPAAGGSKEMALRASEAGGDSDIELEPRLRDIFRLIAMATISTSALEARHLGLLRDKDHIAMNAEHRIETAKQDVLALAREGYRPPGHPQITVMGRPGLALLKLGIHSMHRAGYISDHDKVVATCLAEVLTGGDSLLGMSKVSEQYLLDLEREAFLSLCGQAKTQERMEYMLKNGKPLRN
jgi:3-hydroxyacyl-CoA dehydrogenase